MLPRVSGTKTRRHLLWRRWWACARRSRMNEHCTCTSKKYTERIGTLCELELHWYWSSHFHLNIQTSASMANPSSSKIALAPSWAWGRVHPVDATDCQATLCLEFSKNQRKSQSHISKVIQSHLYTVTVMPLSTLDTNHKKITCSGQTHKKETQQTSNSWYMNHSQATVCSLQNGLGWAKRRSLTTLRRVRSMHPVPKQGMISTTQKQRGISSYQNIQNQNDFDKDACHAVEFGCPRSKPTNPESPQMPATQGTLCEHEPVKAMESHTKVSWLVLRATMLQSSPVV